jgi:hypothetical protein
MDNMKRLIKKLLRENLTNDNEILNDPLYIEGKKYFPNLSVRNVSTHYDLTEKPRFFINYKKNKGSYSYNSFKNMLTNHKINKTTKWLNNKGKMDDFNASISTNSIYFTFNGIPVRISDHPKKSNGVDIIIKWDTQSNEIINQLNKLIK